MARTPDCPLKLAGEPKCTGKVHVTQPPTPVPDAPGVTLGVAICDTCQSVFEAWFHEGTNSCNMLVTSGRSRGLPMEDTTFYTEESE